MNTLRVYTEKPALTPVEINKMEDMAQVMDHFSHHSSTAGSIIDVLQDSVKDMKGLSFVEKAGLFRMIKTIYQYQNIMGYCAVRMRDEFKKKGMLEPKAVE